LCDWFNAVICEEPVHYSEVWLRTCCLYGASFPDPCDVAGSQLGHDVAHGTVVFVEEDVAASEMWQETADGETDGLQFLRGNVLVFVLCSPQAAFFESAD
jgi:hypothetical protein